MNGGEQPASAREPRILNDLYGLLRGYRWQVLTFCILAATSVILSFAPHVFVWWLGDRILEQNVLPDDRTLALACLLLVAALAARYGLAGITSIGSHFIAFKVQRDIRQKLAEKLAAVPLGFLENQRRGKLSKLAVDDVEGLEDGLAHIIPELTACTISPLLLMAVMFAFDWRMALFALLPVVVSFVVLGYLMKKGEDATRRYQDNLSEIGAVAQETIAAFPLVKTHGANSIVLDRATAAFKRFRDETADWIRKALVPSVWFQVLTTSAPAIVLPAGVYFYLDQTLSLSTALLFFILSMSIGNVFSALGSLSHRLSNQKDILDRIFAVLNEPSLPVPDTPRSPSGHDVRFEGVSFAYDDALVLETVDLSIAEGECIALVGPSGSGKSTMLRLLSRFWDVTSGSIKIGGVDIRDLSPDALNNLISAVFQDVFLFSQSIADNIRLGRPDAGDAAVIAAAKAAQADDFICALPDGYDTVLAEGGKSLSGGQQQRISIARAILHDAPILLLDEATAYADPQNELKVQKAISELAKSKTVIVIAHRLNTVTDVDRIVVFDQGRIVDQGRHGALLARCALYQKLWTDHVGSSAFRFGTSANDALTAPRLGET